MVDREFGVERIEKEPSLVLIFAGPHAAGKDTLEARFSQARPDSKRIVRHISRRPTASEQDGIDYHFVTHEQMLQMAERGEFIEYAEYPGVISGTTFAAIEQATEQAKFATITLNFEDGLLLASRLNELGTPSECLFIGPCSEETMVDSPEEYLGILADRMLMRGRATDDIKGRLIMAARYRELYLQHRGLARYINNSNGQVDAASAQLDEL